MSDLLVEALLLNSDILIVISAWILVILKDSI